MRVRRERSRSARAPAGGRIDPAEAGNTAHATCAPGESAQESLVALPEPLRRRLARVLLANRHVRPRPPAPSAFRVRRERSQFVRQVNGAARGEEEAVPAVAHELRIAADVRRNHGAPAGHCFHQRIRERLVRGGQDEHVDARVPRRYVECGGRDYRAVADAGVVPMPTTIPPSSRSGRRAGMKDRHVDAVPTHVHCALVGHVEVAGRGCLGRRRSSRRFPRWATFFPTLHTGNCRSLQIAPM